MTLETGTKRSGLSERRCVAFEDDRRIAVGELENIASTVKKIIDENPAAAVLIFDEITSDLVEVDFRGSAEEVLSRLAFRSTRHGAADGNEASDSAAARGPGRPKLGVIGKEVTLLPRHWEWLNSQPGGASVALRKLVEEARRANQGKDRVRRSREATYSFILEPVPKVAILR